MLAIALVEEFAVIKNWDISFLYDYQIIPRQMQRPKKLLNLFKGDYVENLKLSSDADLETISKPLKNCCNSCKIQNSTHSMILPITTAIHHLNR